MRVLIIKLSSMGDTIHLLPALTDAVKNVKDISFDWVVEKSFAEIPAWHPHVVNVIPVQLREFRNINLQQLRANYYDVIIDAQGLLKSAIIGKLARGKKLVGFDKNSVKEKLASFFYKEKFYIKKQQHAITRLRELFAKIFNYKFIEDKINYGISKDIFTQYKYMNIEEAYGMFVHATTWPSKHWPEHHWVKLLEIAKKDGFEVYATWEKSSQLTRIQEISRLSKHSYQINILPKLTINQVAAIIAGASFVVAVDTGFAHLAAALGIPIVTLFGATSPDLTGAKGEFAVNIASDIECSPCLQKKCRILKEQKASGFECSVLPCFVKLTPDLVWKHLPTI